MSTAEIVPLQSRDIAVDPDGWQYDVATGEVLGRVDLPERFVVDSDEAADWVLKLRSSLEGDIAGIDARLSAVRNMLQAMRQEKVRRLSWWDWKFGASLKDFARQKIAGSKARTARFTWGQVAFRKTAGSNQIMDMPAAVEWMKTWDPKRVKVEERVTVKDVQATIQTVAATTGEAPERPSWLASTGESESVKITTGIEIKLEKGDE